MNRLEYRLVSIFNKASKSNLNCPIVMACDSNFFELTKLAIISIVLRHNCKIYLYDLGLSSSEIEWLESFDVEVLPPPETIIPRNILGWQTFNKPTYLEAVPSDKAIWLDHDIVVVGDLQDLAKHIEKQPLFTKCYHLPNGQFIDPKFHWHMHTNLIPHHSGPPNINAGILGLNKSRSLDRSILQKWILGTNMLLEERPRLDIASNNYWDQCVLQWVLESESLLNLVQDKIGWNEPFWLEPNWSRTSESFYNKVQSCESTILHFAGTKKRGVERWPANVFSRDLLSSSQNMDRLKIFILHHGSNRPNFIERGYEAFDLNSINLPNELAETRFFLSKTAQDADEEYIGVVTGSWDQKYGNLTRLDNIYWKVFDLLREDVVIYADPAPSYWVRESEANHPGITPLIHEMADFMGVKDFHNNTLYANNFICHRSIWKEFLALWRRVYSYFNAKYYLHPPFEVGNFDHRRKVAYLYERFTMIFFASRKLHLIKVDEQKIPVML